jgi:hypothetical protein
MRSWRSQWWFVKEVSVVPASQSLRPISEVFVGNCHYSEWAEDQRKKTKEKFWNRALNAKDIYRGKYKRKPVLYPSSGYNRTDELKQEMQAD